MDSFIDHDMEDDVAGDETAPGSATKKRKALNGRALYGGSTGAQPQAAIQPGATPTCLSHTLLASTLHPHCNISLHNVSTVVINRAVMNLCCNCRCFVCVHSFNHPKYAVVVLNPLNFVPHLSCNSIQVQCAKVCMGC